MAKRVVIVGAGPGGLASAMLLARAGLSVTIVERLPYVGGRTSTQLADGFRFDLGPTFFLYPPTLEKIFRAVGRELKDEIELVKLDPQYRLIFGAGGELNATPDVERMEAEVARLSPRDAGSFKSFLADNRVKFERFRDILQSPFNSWRDLTRWNVMKSLPYVRPWSSLEQDLGRFFHDERIRLAFSFQSKYLGMSPYNCPSLFSILSFMEYEYGVHHPIGGCGAVSSKMAEIAQDLGVDIRLGEDVEEVLFEGRRAVGVRTDHDTYPADSLIINADFARAMTRMVPDHIRRRWTDKKIERKKFSCSTYMLYLGIEGRFDDLAHHTIYVSEDYNRNLREIEKDHVLSADPSFYVQNACVTDPTLAPDGMSTLYVLVPVSHQHPNVDWTVERDRYRQLVLRQLGKVGIDNLESRIRYERIVTPDDWSKKYEIYRGATFNLAHNLTQMLHLRPHNRFEDLESVYLVGGGTHPGSGLPVIYESARITSRLLLSDMEMSHDWIDNEDQETPAFAEVTPDALEFGSAAGLRELEAAQLDRAS